MIPSIFRIIALQVFFLLMVTSVQSQGTTCNSAEPFCTGTGEVFSNTTGAGNAQTGPNYGCLGSTPNPSWFFMQVGASGNINLTITQTTGGGGGLDVDFICWGPFSTLTGVCNQLTAGNIEDCSFSIASVETCTISNANAGEFYVVLITNYSNGAGNIDFQQTSGAGEADCDILNPCNVDAGTDQSICTGGPVQLGGAPSASGGDGDFIYSWSPIAGLDDPTSPNPMADPAVPTTYTLTIDDEAGCTLTDEVIVSIAPIPTITVPPLYTMCEGESATVTFTFNGTAPFEFEYSLNGIPQGLQVPFGNSYNLFISENTLVEVVSISDLNCSGNPSASTQVQVSDTPSATIGGEGTYCEGEIISLPVTLIGSGPFELDYTIDGVPQPSVIFTNTNSTIVTNQAGNYEITSISDDNCNAGIQNSSQVNFFPPIDITLTYDDIICASELVSIEAVSTGGQSGIYAYEWTDADGNIYSGNPIEVSSTSDITVELIVNDDCNIPYTTQADITVQSEPFVDFITVGTLDCLNSETQLDGSISDSGSFLWSTIDGNIVSATDMETITIDQPGIYTLEVTTENDCIGSNSNSIATSFVLTSATLEGPNLLCESEVGSFSIVLDESAIWDIVFAIDGDIQPSTTVNGTQFDFSSSQSGLYEIISASYGSCDAEILNDIEVTIEEIPSVSFPSEDLFLCDGESTLVEVLVTGEGLLTFDYSIDGQTPEVVSMNAGTFNLTIGSAGYVTPVSVSSLNCVGSVFGGFEMNIAALPSAILTESNYTICEGGVAEVQLTLEGSSPFEFQYSIDGTTQDSQTSPNNVFTIPVTEEGTLEIISVSDANCDGSASGLSVVTVNPIPSASISGGLTVCTGEIVTLPITLEGTGPFEIGYSIDGASPTIILSPSLSYDLEATIPGTYTLTSISDALCNDGVQNATTVAYFPSIAVDLQYDPAICENDTVNILAIASGGVGDGYSFQWSDQANNSYYGSALTFILEDPLDLALIVNDECNLPSSESLSIDVQAYPEPSFFALDDSLCIGESTDFFKDSEDSAVQCNWTFDTGATLIGCDGVNYSFLTPGYQSLTLAATTSAGCLGSFTGDSVLYILPDPSAEFLIIPMEGTIFNPEIQFENVSEYAVEYLWDFGDDQLGSEQSPLHSYPVAVTDSYIACLSAFNELGCLDTVCHFLEIAPEYLMSIPNAFTPDDDGVNDLFRPVFNTIVLAEYEIEIFNRSGEVVFHSTDQFEPWNGSGDTGSDYYGMDVMYIYRIVTREENRSQKREFIGEVLLIR